jgi:quinol-cytochrome oxidoreductase complex cytochrome b subunit
MVPGITSSLIWNGEEWPSPLIAMVHYVWTVPRQSSARLHQIAKKGKDVSAYIVGLALADILFWLVRSSGASYSDLPFNEWIAIIAAVNIWVLSLTVSLALGAMRAGTRIRALEAHEKHMDRQE